MPDSLLAVSKGRVEAFSDGVIAILITIMVLELHTPTGHLVGRATARIPRSWPTR